MAHRIAGWTRPIRRASSPNTVFASSSLAAESPLLPGCQGTGVDDEDGFLQVQHKNHLEKPGTSPLAPDEPLVIFDLSRERTPSRPNDHFRFVGRNPVGGDVLDVPAVPAELHE